MRHRDKGRVCVTMVVLSELPRHHPTIGGHLQGKGTAKRQWVMVLLWSCRITQMSNYRQMRHPGQNLSPALPEEVTVLLETTFRGGRACRPRNAHGWNQKQEERGCTYGAGRAQRARRRAWEKRVRFGCQWEISSETQAPWPRRREEALVGTRAWWRRLPRRFVWRRFIK